MAAVTSETRAQPVNHAAIMVLSLFALYAGGPDDLQPFVLLGHHEFAELGGAHLDDRASLLVEPLLEGRRGDHFHGVGMEARDDVRRRLGRREYAPPDPGLVTGHGLRNRRHVAKLETALQTA